MTNKEEGDKMENKNVRMPNVLRAKVSEYRVCHLLVDLEVECPLSDLSDLSPS